MTVVDRPDNGQDEGREYLAGLRRHSTNPTLLRAVAEVEAELDALASGRAGAGEQQREQMADEHGKHWFHWMQQHPGWLARCGCQRWEEPVRDDGSASAIHRRWRLHVADELLALLGGPQPDGAVDTP